MGNGDAVMTGEPVPLTQQIVAVETAAHHYLALAEKSIEHSDELEAIAAALEEAAGTLKLLEFTREVAR